jgi:hypothetical protein
MRRSRERILQMVEEGTVSAAEGEALLAALDVKKRWRWRLLVDPFEHLGGAAGAVCAGVVALASLALTRLHIRFDRALDLHVWGPGSLSSRALSIRRSPGWARRWCSG